MKKKLSLFMTTSLLLTNISPTLVFADSEANNEHNIEANQIDDEHVVNLYEDKELTKSKITIKKEDIVILREVINDEIIYVEYSPQEVTEGIESPFKEEFFGYLSINELDVSLDVDETLIDEEINIFSEEDEDADSNHELDTDTDIDTDSEIDNDEIEKEEVLEEDSTFEREVAIAPASLKTYNGIAIANRTNVYEGRARSSKVLRSYTVGSTLIYRDDTSSDWYQATVIISGKKFNGFIHKNDVEVPTNSPKNLQGIGLKSPTKVYKSPNTTSGVWRSYTQGAVLRYQTFTKDWYKATVIIGGKKQTGYIHKNDVEEPTSSPQNLRGIGLTSPTKVYKSPNTASGVWRSYSQGAVLRYQTFTKDWYKATVIIGGKKQTGYIHKNDVEEPTSSPQNLQGIGLKSPTKVYKSPKTTSGVWRSYTHGTVLRYRTFTKDWYEATVIIGGKKQTGYIRSSDVEAPDTDSKSFRGIALNNNTHVYAEGSTSSKILRSYHVGSVLQYKSYSENWYQATVILNGKKVTGFIRKTHVRNGKEGQPTLKGVTQRNNTPIYQRASKTSPILRRHKIGDIIEYTALTNEWYETKVYSGKQVNVGYVYHTDIATEVVTYTNYGISLQKALEIQTKNIGKYPIEQYHSYIDPNNHNKLQHVRLDKSIGVSATQLNKILAGLGTLGRQGQAFINGGKKHGINEAYLIAHAIHETGRGQSALAQGIEVGMNSKGKATMVTNSNRKNLRNIRTTYNMFGIGAIDKNANKYGSETAYENGWFSPQAAIEGGANWISGQYIQNEHQQNTLYKMRWNPNMAFGYHWKQYATDPGWAVKQTTFIENIYKQLDNPIYHYDIPIYR